MKTHSQPIHRIYNINMATNKIGCHLWFSCSKCGSNNTFRSLKAHVSLRSLSLSLSFVVVAISFSVCRFACQCLHAARQFERNTNEKESEIFTKANMVFADFPNAHRTHSAEWQSEWHRETKINKCEPLTQAHNSHLHSESQRDTNMRLKHFVCKQIETFFPKWNWSHYNHSHNPTIFR